MVFNFGCSDLKGVINSFFSEERSLSLFPYSVTPDCFTGSLTSVVPPTVCSLSGVRRPCLAAMYTQLRERHGDMGNSINNRVHMDTDLCVCSTYARTLVTVCVCVCVCVCACACACTQITLFWTVISHVPHHTESAQSTTHTHVS